MSLLKDLSELVKANVISEILFSKYLTTKIIE